MISYRITSKSTSPSGTNTSGNNARDKIFQRAVKKASKNLPDGQLVEFIGNKRKATVIEVVKDINKVHWKGEKPFYIKIKFHDNDQCVLCHSSSLRKVNK